MRKFFDQLVKDFFILVLHVAVDQLKNFCNYELQEIILKMIVRSGVPWLIWMVLWVMYIMVKYEKIYAVNSKCFFWPN